MELTKFEKGYEFKRREKTDDLANLTDEEVLNKFYGFQFSTEGGPSRVYSRQCVLLYHDNGKYLLYLQNHGMLMLNPLDYLEEIPESDFVEIIRKILSFKIYEWKEKYEEEEGCRTFDGRSIYTELLFNDGTAIWTNGYENFPKNWKSFYSYMEELIGTDDFFNTHFYKIRKYFANRYDYRIYRKRENKRNINYILRISDYEKEIVLTSTPAISKKKQKRKYLTFKYRDINNLINMFEKKGFDRLKYFPQKRYKLPIKEYETEILLLIGYLIDFYSQNKSNYDLYEVAKESSIDCVYK